MVVGGTQFCDLLLREDGLRLHLRPRLHMTWTTSSCPPICMLCLALPQLSYMSYVGLLYIAAKFCLLHFLTTRPLLIAPYASSQSFSFPAGSLPSIQLTPASHLSCRPLASLILRRLIAFQNGFVLVQLHPHELFPRYIPLLFGNSYRLHRFIPRFPIHSFRPSNEIDRLYYPSLARPVLVQDLVQTTGTSLSSSLSPYPLHGFDLSGKEHSSR